MCHLKWSNYFDSVASTFSLLFFHHSLIYHYCFPTISWSILEIYSLFHDLPTSLYVCLTISSNSSFSILSNKTHNIYNRISKGNLSVITILLLLSFQSHVVIYTAFIKGTQVCKWYTIPIWAQAIASCSTLNSPAALGLRLLHSKFTIPRSSTVSKCGPDHLITTQPNMVKLLPQIHGKSSSH
jgi:hypothetical protein